MGKPWNNRYHVTCHTYGSWLLGDPRGFRTRHHREHVEGDYKNPPPRGIYEWRHANSKKLMKRPAVHLDMRQRKRVVELVAQSLLKREIEVVIIAVDSCHMHLLARFNDHNPRLWVGISKKESSAYLKREGIGSDGGIWALRNKCDPVKDRSHQLNIVHYIAKHAEQDAAIWMIKQK
ncbi:MAG TPA: hypothetical protein PK402_06435 [Tepidisphaeraceae bacterium]|nr:hypothetical protein [Tepidisphaeraceae bacterium]